MAHPKGLLMEQLKKQGISPEFRTANTGPDHEPTFLTDVVVNGEVLGTGQGGNKRESERLASEEALAFLERNPLELEAVAPAKGSGSTAKKGEQKGGGKGQQAKKGGEKETAEQAKKGGQKEGTAAQAKTTRQKKGTAEPPKSAAPVKGSAEQPKKGGQKGGPAGQAKKSEARASALPAESADGRFEGPWPVFENLLAGIVEVAGERVDEDLKGEEARIAVLDFTLELYKDLLEDLGDVVEEDDDE